MYTKRDALHQEILPMLKTILRVFDTVARLTKKVSPKLVI